MCETRICQLQVVTAWVSPGPGPSGCPNALSSEITNSRNLDTGLIYSWISGLKERTYNTRCMTYLTLL